MKLYFALLLLLFACVPAAMPLAGAPKIVELANGSTFDLVAGPVAKMIGGERVGLFGYNGQVPGPVLKVRQNSTVTVNFKNLLDMPTTVHWHGIRLDNEYDGVPDITQSLVQPGASFKYVLTFPDDGVYWYHPHVREDFQQEMGLYGNILVVADYPSADREEFIFLDDARFYLGEIEPFSPDKANYALMGRFGTKMLVDGQTDYSLNATTGEVVRLFITASANTRMFNFSIENADLKVIGGDSGLYEREFFADSVVLSPGERVIADVVFEKPGKYRLLHTNPIARYELGVVDVEGPARNASQKLLNHDNGAEEFRKYFNSSLDFEVVLTLETQMNHRRGGVHFEPIEWEDSMEMMNAMSTSKSVRWIIRDKKTGNENMDVAYEVSVGDVKKLRIFNDPNSMHPMQHPIHIHGQRFLVVSENGRQNDNLVWKDTVVVPAGEYVDILVHFTNPGDWVFHCHIAEHLEAGMMSLFKVAK